ncbi:MAG: DUF6011 domain-containing protein [Synergistaceae bacterium]|nr:DUF6011 domain-containing protein [Synergistaceae bacterium]
MVRFCVLCGRRLKSARSVDAGVGPKCLKKLQNCTETRQTLLFDEERELP